MFGETSIESAKGDEQTRHAERVQGNRGDALANAEPQRGKSLQTDEGGPRINVTRERVSLLEPILMGKQ
ncbi:MAG: hypothetical protein EAZ21_11975 [Betaproteobacteria bacterium]|nr:MAG: hypothetical protein EAZ21_11975 [Betaproteobacteria bacterium]